MNHNVIPAYVIIMIKSDITNQGTFKTRKYYKNLAFKLLLYRRNVELKLVRIMDNLQT